MLAEAQLPATVPCDDLREAVLAYPRRGGKCLRGALLLWCHGLFAPPGRGAWYLAAGVEVYHAWTLVHDDIIDEDASRRGGLTAHRLLAERVASAGQATDGERAAKYGRDLAILAGDVQQGWANQLMLEAADHGVSVGVVMALLRRVNGVVTPQLVGGEALDVALELEPFERVGPGAITEMLRLKTGVLLRFAAEAGAMAGLGCADATDDRVRWLGDFAERAGLAFQLRDDVLGMFGDPGDLGKPVGSDLRQGKRTALFAEGMARLCGEERECLAAALGRRDGGEATVASVQALLRGCGALAAVEERVAALSAEARAALEGAPSGRSRQLLEAWLRFVCDRSR